MNSSWISQLGNSNPQLLREFRGRLRPRSVAAAIGLSITIQGLILFVFTQTQSEILPEDWLNLWSGFFWVLPYALIIVGGYYLVGNLTQEEKSGTLNFIRLSPRPAWQILLGKLLGVPVLPVIMIAFFFPLHWLIALLAQVPLSLVLSYYLILAVNCLLCWSLAMLFGLVGSFRSGWAGQATTLGITYSAIALIMLLPALSTWNTAIVWRPLTKGIAAIATPIPVIKWVWMPLNNNALISHGFTLLNCGIVLFILWRIMLRRFRRPRTTLLSKRQSYGIMAYVLIFLMGFFLTPEILKAPEETSFEFGINSFLQGSALLAMLFATYFLSLFLMGAICPHRQALMEWSRQSQQNIMGLIWSDKSPAGVSFAILLLIATAILVPFALLFPQTGSPEINRPLSYLVLIFGIMTSLMMIGSYMQYIFALKLRNPSAWFLGSLVLWWIVPSIILGVVGAQIEDTASLSAIWAFLGYPVGHLDSSENLPFVLLGIVGQGVVITVLWTRIQQSLNKFRLAQVPAPSPQP